MITLHITPGMITAGTQSLYRHARAEPEPTVVAIFIAMMQARHETPEIEVQVESAADQHQGAPQHRH